MNCSSCGAPLREHASFCTACGAPVTEQAERLRTMTPPTDVPEPASERQKVRLSKPQSAAPEPTVPEPPLPPDAPIPAPDSGEAPRPEPPRTGALLRQIRGYVAVGLAVCSLVLLFFPWFSVGMEVTFENVTVDDERYDLIYGDVAVEDDADAGTHLSILDVVQYREVTDLFDLSLHNRDAKQAMRDTGMDPDQRIRDALGVPSDLALSKSFRLPTGVAAMTPQLLCILVMFVCFIIGVLRVFAADPFPDGALKTGWLKAGGIVGLVMCVLTGAETLAIDLFGDRFVDALQSSGFDGSIELCVRLIFGYFLFAVVSLLLVLAATHWGRKKRRG